MIAIIQMSELILTKILGSSSVNSHLQFLYRNYLIYVSGSHIIFHNISIDQQQAYISHSNPNISCLAISAYQQHDKSIMVAVGDHQRYSNITLYQVHENLEASQQNLKIEMKMKLKGHRNPVALLEFSPDNRYLMSISNKDGSMFLWDVEIGDRLTQNKNSRNIYALKFCLTGSEEKNNLSGISLEGFSRINADIGYSVVTIGKGHCKVWQIKQEDSMGVHRIQEEEHWMLVGKTISFSKKLALKEFIDIEIWRNSILLLTSDGLLCFIQKLQKEWKFSKCIDLMIQKASSLQVFNNMVLCGGDNSLVKVIDLQQLTLISKLPKPPPKKKQNISKQSEELTEYELAENEQFPRCTGIRYSSHISPLTGKPTYLISTLYENQTIFIWKIISDNHSNQDQQNCLQILATGSIISHQGPIQHLKVLEHFSENNLTFFATVSNIDNTIRIWHIYSKLMYNRESIDLAEIIGVKRNVYCRNLTRILYSETENPILGISSFTNLCNSRRGLACITKNQLIVYSLQNYEIIFHENFQENITQLQIIENLLYVGQENKKVRVYQFLESLNLIRELEFEIFISKMQISPDNKFLVLHNKHSLQTVIYSLTKSKIIHEEDQSLDFEISNNHIIFVKRNQTLVYYHTVKSKIIEFISLKHELSVVSEESKCYDHKDSITRNESHQTYQKVYEEESIVKICANSIYVMVLTNHGRIIVCNFSGVIISVAETNQKINDFAITDGNDIILVGNHGNILIYNFKGGATFQEMGKQMKNWIQRNDLSWMQGSVWARKKSTLELANSSENRDSSKNILIGSDSIRLATSIKIREQLPNVEIKYKSDRNQKSVFNPSDICQQANQIYKQMDNILHVRKTGSDGFGTDSLEEINLVGRSQASSNQLPPKKRIFGLGTKKPPIDNNNNNKLSDSSKKQQQLQDQPHFNHFQNNLVTSVIHNGQKNDQINTPSKEIIPSKFQLSSNSINSNINFTYTEFPDINNLSYSPEKSQTNYQQQRNTINQFYTLLQKYSNNHPDRQLFFSSNQQKLTQINTLLTHNLPHIEVQPNNKQQILQKFNQYMKGFHDYLADQL